VDALDELPAAEVALLDSAPLEDCASDEGASVDEALEAPLTAEEADAADDGGSTWEVAPAEEGAGPEDTNTREDAPGRDVEAGAADDDTPAGLPPEEEDVLSPPVPPGHAARRRQKDATERWTRGFCMGCSAVMTRGEGFVELAAAVLSGCGGGVCSLRLG